MANDISDVTVNITVEDVVNPAAFGGICLYTPMSTTGTAPDLPYTEVYSYDEAKAVLGASNMREVHSDYSLDFSTLAEGTVQKTALNALNSGKYTFISSTYTVEESEKTINGKKYTKRIKAISTNNGINIQLYGTGCYVGVSCCGSSSGKSVKLILKNSGGSIVDSKEITGSDPVYVSLQGGSVSDTYTLCSTSNDGATVHIYGIEQTSASINSRKMLDLVQIAFMQENPPEKIGLLSCHLNDIKNYLNCDWRYMVLCQADLGSTGTVEDIALYIEGCGAYKVLALDITDVGEESISGDGKTLDYDSFKSIYGSLKDLERTFAYVGVPVYDADGESTSNSICTALLAHTGNKEVGSYTYKNMPLKGVYADEGITKSQLEEYHDINVNAYVHKAGYDVTSEGKLVNGEYIDILDAKDWIITQIKYRLQQILIINDKVPYDNNGIAMLESGVVDVLKEAYDNGMIAESEDGGGAYSVNFAKRSETKASDREKRQYVDGKFKFELAGAVHEATVNGTVSI